VAVEYPVTAPGADSAAGTNVLAVVELRDRALSVSAVQGRWFEEGGVVYGHVMDPAQGRPVAGGLLAAAVCDSAADADALATALLVPGPSAAGSHVGRRVGAATLVVARGTDGRPYDIHAEGIAALPLAGP
jgi:FAD:protein FMN transferase